MTDATPPVQPVAPPPPQPELAAEPRKRPIWPWLVGGGGLLLVLVIGTIAAFAIYGIVHASAERTAVQKAVFTFDKAYKNSDCDLFESVTTDEVRDEYTDDDYSCDAWTEIADSLTVDGDYTVTVDINSTTVTGHTAKVTTTEGFDDGNRGRSSSDFLYKLENKDGSWVITSYEES